MTGEEKIQQTVSLKPTTVKRLYAKLMYFAGWVKLSQEELRQQLPRDYLSGDTEERRNYRSRMLHDMENCV